MNRRGWLCLPALLLCAVDAALTLAGQDPEYWAGDHARFCEMNPVGAWLLAWDPLAFVGGIVVWMALVCAAVVYLPPRLAVLAGLGVAVGHTFGAMTWVVRWDTTYPLGMLFGIVLLVAADQTIWVCWRRFRDPPADRGNKAAMTGELYRLFVYDSWANAEAATALRGSAAPPARALQLLAHIIAAQQVWWARMHRQSPLGTVWPDLTLDQCDAALAELRQRWRNYFEFVTDEELARIKDYHNLSGQACQNTTADILRHLAMHGTYHRGQIATHLRLAGLPAAATDFILAARQGVLEQPL